jgi:thiol-disulfide isomerase/thioredoxin
MNKGVKLMIAIIGFVLLLMVSYITYTLLLPQNKPSDSSSPTTTAENSKKKAPDFTVIDANGNNVKFSDLLGKPIIINFWASWCPPCKAEMPDYEEAYQNYSNKGIVFMMINMTDGQRETVDIAKKFLKENNYKFDVYFDVNSDAANIYGISSIPDSIFIDKTGNIINAYVGAVDKATIQKNIDLLLK